MILDTFLVAVVPGRWSGRMIANVAITVVALGVAAFVTRSLRGAPQASRKIAIALIAIGIAAFAFAMVVADGSC